MSRLHARLAPSREQTCDVLADDAQQLSALRIVVEQVAQPIGERLPIRASEVVRRNVMIRPDRGGYVAHRDRDLLDPRGRVDGIGRDPGRGSLVEFCNAEPRHLCAKHDLVDLVDEPVDVFDPVR